MQIAIKEKRTQNEENIVREEDLSEKSQPYACKICGLTFEQDNSRKTHEKDHRKENKCQICGAEYAWLSGLWKHINKINKDRGKYDEKPQSSMVPYILHIQSRRRAKKGTEGENVNVKLKPFQEKKV